jgi:hypothetical protein
MDPKLLTATGPEHPDLSILGSYPFIANCLGIIRLPDQHQCNCRTRPGNQSGKIVVSEFIILLFKFPFYLLVVVFRISSTPFCIKI